MTRLARLAMLLTLCQQGLGARGGEVVGRVEMPAACSPSVSPAVVSLERLDGAVEMGGPEVAAKVALVNQRGLQFDPRVQAVQVGQTVRFTNEDNETHNVHILTPGVSFNQSMGRGRPVDYRTEKPGLLRIVCDVHSHMRGYVVVSPTPYFAVCLTDGRFRLDGVPDGRYRVRAWHEMGRGTTRDFEVRGETPVHLGVLSVDAPPVQTTGPAAPARVWADVIDRVGMLLGEARAVASKAGQSIASRRKEADILPDDFGVDEASLAAVNRARKLVEDAYWQEFEGSAMETAVRRHLGFHRAGRDRGAVPRDAAARPRGRRGEGPGLGDGRPLARAAAGARLGRAGPRPARRDRSHEGRIELDLVGRRGERRRLARPAGGPGEGARRGGLAGGCRGVGRRGVGHDFGLLRGVRAPGEDLRGLSSSGDPAAGGAVQCASRADRGRAEGRAARGGAGGAPRGNRGGARPEPRGGRLRGGLSRLARGDPPRRRRGDPAADHADLPGGESRPAAGDGGDPLGRPGRGRGEPGDGRRPQSGRRDVPGPGPRADRGLGDDGRGRRALLRELLADLAGRVEAVDRVPQGADPQGSRRRRVRHARADGVPGRLPRGGRDRADVPGDDRRPGRLAGRAGGDRRRAGGRARRAGGRVPADPIGEREAAAPHVLQGDGPGPLRHGRRVRGQRRVRAPDGGRAEVDARRVAGPGRELAGLLSRTSRWSWSRGSCWPGRWSRSSCS